MTNSTALLIIDMLNAFDFDGADTLIEATSAIVEPINGLRKTARAAGSSVIYVNDNYNRWSDERAALIAWLSRDEARGGAIARAIAPADDDYFVIKPEASGFYATVLPALLPRLGVSSLVLTGVATDICVLLTAADAHMREYDLWVPEDAVAGRDAERQKWGLTLLRESMSADTRPTNERGWSG
ncbi:MAG: cysteine hydrolase [Proteobacteria bacterium]|nr:cysteine hydrolase [Pseudomonadota bacterium]